MIRMRPWEQQIQSPEQKVTWNNLHLRGFSIIKGQKNDKRRPFLKHPWTQNQPENILKFPWEISVQTKKKTNKNAW